MEEDNSHQSGVMPPTSINGTPPVDEESSTNSNPPGEGHHAAPKRTKMDPSVNQSRKKSHHASKYLEIRLPEGVNLEEMVHFCLRLLDIRRHYCKSRKAKNILVNAMQILDSTDDLDFVNKKYRTGIAQTVFFCGTYEDFCEETQGAEKRVAKASQTIESRVAETPSVKKSDANVQTFLKRTLSKSNQTEMAFAVKKDNVEISTQTESSEDASAGSPRQQFPDSTNLNTVVSLIQSYISPSISGKNRLTLEEEYAEFHRSVEAAANILVNEVEMEAPPPPPPRIPPPPPHPSNATYVDKTVPEDPRLFKNRRASIETHLTSPSAGGGGKNSPETPLKGRLNRSSSNEGTAVAATVCPVIPLENPDVESKPRDPRVASHDVNAAGNGFSPDKKSQGPKPKGCSRQAELAKRQKLKREAKFKKKSSGDEDGDKSEDENSSEPPSPPPLKKKQGPLTPTVPIASGPVEGEIVQAQVPRVYDEQTNAWNEEETIVRQLTQLPVVNETPATLIKPIPPRKLSEDEVRSWNPANVARSTARNPSPPRNSAISELSFVDAKDKRPNQASRETRYSDDDEDVLKIYSSPYSPSKMDDDEDEFLKETLQPVRTTRVNQVAVKRKTPPETTKTRRSSSSPFSGGNLPNYVNATSSPPRESPAKRERIVTPVSAREEIVERQQSESSESSSESSASSQGSSESESESGSESEYEETRKSSRREKEKYERQKAEKRRLEKYERKLAEKYDKKSSGKHHREYKYDKRWFDKYGKYDRKGNPYKRRKKDKKASSYDRKSVSVDKYDKKSVSIEKYDKKSVSIDKYDKKSVSVDKYDKKSVSIEKYDKKSVSVDKYDKKSEVYDKKLDIYEKKSENYDKKSERKSIDYERKSTDKKSSSDYYDKKASESYDKKAVSEDGDKRTNTKKTSDNRDRKKILSDSHDKKSMTDIQDKTLSVNVKESSVIQDKKLSSDNRDKQSLSVIPDKTLSSDNRDTHSSDNRDKKISSDNLVKKSPIDKKLTNISEKIGSSDIIDKKQSPSDVNDKKSVSSDIIDKKQSSSDIIDKKQSSSDITDKKQSSSDILDKKSSVVVDINPSADNRDKKSPCELRLSKWDKKGSKTEEPKSDKVTGTTSEKGASVEQTAKTVDKKAVIVVEKKKPVEMFERLLIANPLRKISVKPPRKIHGETPLKTIQIIGKKPLVDYPIASGENEPITPIDAAALDDKQKQLEHPSLSKSPVPPEPIKFKNSFMPEEALPVKTDKSPPLPEATPQPPLPPAESRVFSPPLPPQLPATRPPLPSEIPPSYAPPLPAEVPPSPPLPPAKCDPSPSRTPPLPPPLPVPPPSDAFNQPFYNINYNPDNFAAGVPYSDPNQTYAFPSNFADGQTFNFASLPPPPPPVSLANAPNRNFVPFQNSFATPPTSVASEFKFIPGGPTDLSFLATPPPVSFIGPVMPAGTNSSTGEKPPPPPVTSGSDTTPTSRVTPGDFATFLASQTTNFQPLKNQRGMSGNQPSPGGGVPQPVPPPPPSGLTGDFNFMGAPFQPQNFNETTLPQTVVNPGNNVPNEFANFLNVIRTNAPFDGSVLQPPPTLPPFATLLPPPNFGQMGSRFPLPLPLNNDFASDATFNFGQEQRPDFGGGSGERTSASDNQTGSDFFFNQDPSGGNSDRRTDGFGNFKQRDNLTFGSERGRGAKRGNGSQSNSGFNKNGNARDFNQSANEFQVPPPSGVNLSEPPPSFFGSRDNFGNATDFFQNNPGSFPNFFNANVANQQREQQTFFEDTSVQESNFPIINQQQMQQPHQTGFQGGGSASNSNFNFRGGNRGGSGNRGGGGSGSRGGRGSRGRSGGGSGSRGGSGPGSRGGRGSRGGSSRFGDGNFQRGGTGGGGFRSRGNFNQRQRHQGGDDFKEMSQQRAQFESPNSDMSGYPSSFKYNKPSQQHGGAGSRPPLLGENGILEPFHQSKRF